MVEIITQYWLEFALGLIAAAMTYFGKHYYSLYKKEKQRKQDDLLEEVKKNITNSENATRQQLKEVESNLSQKIEQYYQKSIQDDEEIRQSLKTLTDGVLTTQGDTFKRQCKDLLNLERSITIDEWAEISAAHEIYHSLNGNHDGDILYQAVETAYLAGLQKK